MINLKSFQWGYGIVVALVMGLSGCYMDGQNSQSQQVDYSSQNNMPNNQSATDQSTGKGKGSASNDPVQKSTPGPKRAAAPQLPVIQ